MKGTEDTEGTLLRVRDLGITFDSYAGEVQAVRGVSFDLRRGETLAVVGESGSGKSVAVKSLMGLLPRNARITSGTATLGDTDLFALAEKEMRRIRGNRIAMVFQDPMTSLDPTMKIGEQIGESLRTNLGLRGAAVRQRAVELLRQVHIPHPEARLKQYPHQLSGGMRQRVVIAIALAAEPEVLIADEPTTALDVTIQAQVLDLLEDLRRSLGMSIILITHDLGVVARGAHRVVVMYGGKIVETGTARDIFHDPRMPYTWGLLTSIPLPATDSSLELTPISGSPPDPLHPPAGCPYHPRCPHAMKVCLEEMPEHTRFGAEHGAACWLLHPLAPRVEPPPQFGGLR
ncbi:ABC transporter ATP-binding protein [Amycolatopsis cihanbeyliensis]|uniref:Oligopeptide transport system ATP-binding protein n=1 Tax=Amycolatopsis cihanbeyliensis TaxID=1128664 RepID=A0A542DLV8_AMYCI|nr:ABC transporter ATP-binding protein [Amycolatopsis cihanbeyliensis]TQJ04071.1 oligopeptide transport system ATP-binding protein [Amycolatopsis cihanbeyliensis]